VIDENIAAARHAELRTYVFEPQVAKIAIQAAVIFTNFAFTPNSSNFAMKTYS
jgi:hypothetical protein